MATIQKRVSPETGKVSYRVMIRLRGHPIQSATFELKTSAKKWAQATEAAIREGRYFKTAESRRHTLSELIWKYIEKVLPLKKSCRDQFRHLRWWDNEIGAYVLADLTPGLIIESRDKSLSENRTRSTANRYMSSLSHVLTIAVKEWGWLETNPMRKISKLPEPRGRTRFLTDMERTRLLEACKDSSNSLLYPAVVLAISTGARRGEIMSLTWDQVDFEREVIILHETKNNQRRVLPLKGHALQVLQEHNKTQNNDYRLVFPGERNPNLPCDLNRQFKNALRKADIDDFRWHDLRHSTASYLAMNGTSLAAIAEILGHKTLSMVKRYAHLSEPYTANEIESMNRKIFGSSS